MGELVKGLFTMNKNFKALQPILMSVLTSFSTSVTSVTAFTILQIVINESKTFGHNLIQEILCA